jgi:ferric-dicitrate binding protein FerR (iron transport regulator)
MPLPPLSPLASEIALEQDQKLKELKLSAQDVRLVPRRARRARFAQRSRRSATGQSRLAGVAAVVGLVLVGALLLVVFSKVSYRVLLTTAGEQSPQTPANDEPVGRWVAAQTGEHRELAFSDGTRAVLRPGARLRVLDLGLRGGSLVLETGSVELQVEGTRFTEYQVSAGPFHLTIPRGRVTATWNPMTSQLDLVVLEGFAVIAGCQFAEGRSVTAGKELGTHCSEP